MAHDPAHVNDDDNPEDLQQCAQCKQWFYPARGEINFEPDPYLSDVQGDMTPVWICVDCAYERAQDI